MDDASAIETNLLVYPEVPAQDMSQDDFAMKRSITSRPRASIYERWRSQYGFMFCSYVIVDDIDSIAGKAGITVIQFTEADTKQSCKS